MQETYEAHDGAHPYQIGPFCGAMECTLHPIKILCLENFTIFNEACVPGAGLDP